MGFSREIVIPSPDIPEYDEIADMLEAGESVSPVLIVQAAVNHIYKLQRGSEENAIKYSIALGEYDVKMGEGVYNEIATLAQILGATPEELDELIITKDSLRDAVDFNRMRSEHYQKVIQDFANGNTLGLEFFANKEAEGWYTRSALAQEMGVDGRLGEESSQSGATGFRYLGQFWKLAATYAVLLGSDPSKVPQTAKLN